MTTYVATVLLEEWRECAGNTYEAYRLLYDGDSLQLVRTAGGAIPDVDVCLNVHHIKHVRLVTQLLRHEHTPFTISAVCRPDPVLLPLALEISVCARQLQHDLDTQGTTPGEAEFVELLSTAARSNMLVRCARHGAAELAAPRPRKKQRVLHHTEPAAVDAWMREREASTSMPLPQYIFLHGSTYVFCLRDFVFVPQLAGKWAQLHVTGGILVGERNVGKAAAVRRLLADKSQVHTLTPPSFLRALQATLLVVPAAMVHQWSELCTAAHLSVAVIHNKRSWSQCSTFPALSACDVVLVTHSYYYALLRKPCAKHKSRVFVCSGASDTRARLDWFYWARIIVDEPLQLWRRPTFSFRKLPSLIRARSWWLVQGNLCSTSLEMSALVDMLVTAQQQTSTTPCVNVDLLSSCFMTMVCSVPPLPLCLERLMPVELSEVERDAYDVLNSAGVPVTQLIQVCGGDLTPLRLFMRPVKSWVEAVPLGVEVMNEYNEYIVDNQADVELNWSTGEDEEGGEEEAVQQHDDSGHSETEALERVQGMITRLLNDGVSDVSERREFFLRAGQALIQGEEAGTCPICLSSESDCLFVCGHQLCHGCVVELFVSAKMQEQELMQERGYSDFADGYLAPCPTCRWSLEPHEVFWVTGACSRGGKVAAVGELLRELVSQQERVVVVVGTGMVELVHSVCADWVQQSLPCRVLSISAVTCRANLVWFTAAPGRVLLVYHEQLQGLKLPDVAHVVLLHPHASGAHHHSQMKQAVVHAVGGQSRRPVTMYQFMAKDTVEDVWLQQTLA